jgi:hypothetical protein
MEKIKELVKLLTSLRINLKLQNRKVHPWMAYLIFLFGALQVLKYLGKAYSFLLMPTLKKLFYRLFRDR